MSLALTLVEDVGWVAAGALVAIAVIVSWRGIKIHLYRHDDEPPPRG